MGALGKSGEKSGTQAVEILTELVARAKRKGATAAEAMMVDGVSMSVSQRLGLRGAELEGFGLPTHLQRHRHAGEGVKGANAARQAAAPAQAPSRIASFEPLQTWL